MSGHEWISDCVEELRVKADPAHRESVAGHFKVDVSEYWGVKTPDIRETARVWQPAFNQLCPDEQIELCYQLLEQRRYEFKILCFQWMKQVRKTWNPDLILTFEDWLFSYINDWTDCDDFCSSLTGEFICRYPSASGSCVKWMKTDNMWARRAAAVSMIKPAKQSNRLLTVFAISDKLLYDDEDLVRKAAAWLLKETSKSYPGEVFEFLKTYQNKIPAQLLRVSAKKLPDELHNRLFR